MKTNAAPPSTFNLQPSSFPGWERKDRYYWQRGEFKVCVSYGGADGKKAKYSAWGPPLPPLPGLADPARPGYGRRVNPLGVFGSLREARARCDRDANE